MRRERERPGFPLLPLVWVGVLLGGASWAGAAPDPLALDPHFRLSLPEALKPVDLAVDGAGHFYVASSPYGAPTIVKLDPSGAPVGRTARDLRHRCFKIAATPEGLVGLSFAPGEDRDGPEHLFLFTAGGERIGDWALDGEGLDLAVTGGEAVVLALQPLPDPQDKRKRKRLVLLRFDLKERAFLPPRKIRDRRILPYMTGGAQAGDGPYIAQFHLAADPGGGVWLGYASEPTVERLTAGNGLESFRLADRTVDFQRPWYGAVLALSDGRVLFPSHRALPAGRFVAKAYHPAAGTWTTVQMPVPLNPTAVERDGSLYFLREDPPKTYTIRRYRVGGGETK